MALEDEYCSYGIYSYTIYYHNTYTYITDKL